MALKVYGAYPSTCTMRVISTILEVNATFELIPVNLAKKEQKSLEHLQIQPFGQVPVLKDGEINIFESRAIIRYIASKYSSEAFSLIGSTLKEKALIDQWLEVEHSNFYPPASAIFREKVLKKRYGGVEDAAIVASETEKLGNVLDVYDKQLEKQPYLAGDQYSLADLSHLSISHYLINVANFGDVFLSRPNVKAWWERISSREAWKKTVQLALPK